LDALTTKLKALRSSSEEGAQTLSSVGGVLRALAVDAEGTDRAPTAPQREVLAVYAKRLGDLLREWDPVQRGELAAANAALTRGHLERLEVQAPAGLLPEPAGEGEDRP